MKSCRNGSRFRYSFDAVEAISLYGVYKRAYEELAELHKLAEGETL